MNIIKRVAVGAALALGATGLAIAPASASSSPVQVGRTGYQAATQDSNNACFGTVDPTWPASVVATIKTDRISSSAGNRGWTSTGIMRTGNGLPTVTYRQIRAAISYEVHNGMLVQVQRHPVIRRAWVPGYAGASCSTWTVLQWSTS